MDYKIHLLNLRDFKPLQDVKTEEDVEYWKTQFKKIAEDLYGKNCLQISEIEQIRYVSHEIPITKRVISGNTAKLIPSTNSHTNIKTCRESLGILVLTFMADIENINNKNLV